MYMEARVSVYTQTHIYAGFPSSAISKETVY